MGGFFLLAVEGVSDPVLEVEFVHGSVESSNVLTLDLKTAINLALENNVDFRVRELKVESAQQSILVQKSEFDPELNGQIRLDKDRSSQTNRGTGARYDVKNEGTELNLKLVQNLSTGTTLELETSLKQDVSDRTPEQQEGRVAMNLVHPLLRGSSRNVVWFEVSLASMELELTKYELQAYAETLVASIELMYWDLILANKKVELFETSLEIARKNKTDVVARIASGMMAESMLAAVESEIALREQSLIDASSEVYELKWRLWSLLRAPNEQTIPEMMVKKELDEPFDLKESKQELLILAKSSRADLMQAKLMNSQRQLELEVTKNGLMPKLDFFTTLGKSGYDSNAKSAWGNIGEKAYDLSMGLEFQLKLGSRGEKAKHVIAINSKQQSELALENLERQIEMELHLTWHELERSRKQELAAIKTVALQKETVRVEQVRLENGLGTALLLAQAQRDLIGAQLSQLNAQVAIKKAQTNLYRVSGCLLNRRDLVLH